MTARREAIEAPIRVPTQSRRHGPRSGTLEDMLGVEERPNMPTATGAPWASRRLALPAPLEEIRCAPGAQEVA